MGGVCHHGIGGTVLLIFERFSHPSLRYQYHEYHYITSDHQSCVNWFYLSDRPVAGRIRLIEYMQCSNGPQNGLPW